MCGSVLGVVVHHCACFCLTCSVARVKLGSNPDLARGELQQAASAVKSLAVKPVELQHRIERELALLPTTSGTPTGMIRINMVCCNWIVVHAQRWTT